MYIFLLILTLLMPIPLYIGFMSIFADNYRQKSLLAVRHGFKRLIKRHRLSISGAAVYRDRLIAIDRKMNILVLVVYKNSITWEKCVNVNEIISYRVVKRFNKVNGCIQKVNLELNFRNDETIIFPFFDEEVDDLRDIHSAIKKARNWKRKIQYQISTVQSTNANPMTIQLLNIP